MKLRYLILITIWALTSPFSRGADLILLNDPEESYFLSNQRVEVLEDQEGKWTIQEISSPSFDKFFIPLKTEFPENEHPGSTYWMKVTIQNELSETQWIFESYNFRVYLLELYIPDGKGGFTIKRAGAGLNFEERILNHKNFEFLLPNLSSEPQNFYIKFISYDESMVRTLIRSYVKFTSYALNEYFLLGIFYGMIIIISLYNLFLFIRLNDRAYLYYSMYGLFVGVFSMVQDGTGFQYLWPGFPEFNKNALFFSSTLMVVFMMMYTRSFLETRTQLPLLDKILTWTILARILLFFIEALLLPAYINFIWMDILPFLLAYTASIIAYRKDNSSALYFVLGFSILFFGFSVNTLRLFKVVPSMILTNYSVNIVVIIEMLLLSLALAERVKKSRENELIKENLNRELEQKVKERTEAIMIQKNIIEEKVKTLDTFIYKASHDIKGPLKSLIGITDLGLKDTKENAHIYFEHALKTAKKLDAILKDLLHITRVNNAQADLEEINFSSMVAEVLDTLKKLPGYDQIDIQTSIKQQGGFLSEKTILYSIFQNFIENGIKYRNPRVKQSFLKIEVKADNSIAEIKFTDNGIGIPNEYQDKVFEMFFKVDNRSEDSTGLGLYIVKLSIEKLGGQLLLQSKHGEGSTFTVLLKNHQPAS